jgi:hypothetical protein
MAHNEFIFRTNGNRQAATNSVVGVYRVAISHISEGQHSGDVVCRKFSDTTRRQRQGDLLRK